MSARASGGKDHSAQIAQYAAAGAPTWRAVHVLATPLPPGLSTLHGVGRPHRPDDPARVAQREARAAVRRARRARLLALATGERLPEPARWTGPVERRDPAAVRDQTTTGLARCRWCRAWATVTALVCRSCGAPRPGG